MKTLFVTDMDGTLLSTDSRVTPESASIISELTDRGALITVATARTPATVEPLLRSVRMTPPAIVLTGAAMWDRHEKKFLNVRYMTDSQAEAVTEACHAAGLRPMIYTIADTDRIEMYVADDGHLSKAERNFLDERRHLQYKHINMVSAASAPRSYPRTVLVLALGPLESVMAAGEKLRAGQGYSLSAYPDIFNPSMGILEVFAPGVSKASALLELKRQTGADRLTVFGDNLNDIPMMEVADHAVAVGNAQEAVRRIADEVIGPNSADSVARYIASHV